jgi:hypothetical protein
VSPFKNVTLPSPQPSPAEGESMSASEKTYAFDLSSDGLEGSLSQREGWGALPLN